MRIRDIVIHTNAGVFGKEEELSEFPPVKDRIELFDRIWIGPLDGAMARAIMDTCEPKVLGAPAPVRQFGALYAFVREDVDGHIYQWDRGNVLNAVVGLSRLIHPTSIGFKYAARIEDETTGVRAIFPANIDGVSKKAFLSPNRTRDWFSAADAEILRGLQPALHALPPRIHIGLWHHEYASRTYYLDHRWTLICTGLEALLHTDRGHSTRQFTKRVPQLARELGMVITEDEASEAYDKRSRLAHGVSFLATGAAVGPSKQEIELYDKLEDILRRATLNAIRDVKFGQFFRDDDAIRSRWPI